MLITITSKYDHSSKIPCWLFKEYSMQHYPVIITNVANHWFKQIKSTFSYFYNAETINIFVTQLNKLETEISFKYHEWKNQYEVKYNS